MASHPRIRAAEPTTGDPPADGGSVALIDRSSIATHLGMIFAAVVAGDLIEIKAIARSAGLTPPSRQRFCGNAHRAIAIVIAWALAGYDTYVGANPRSHMSGSAAAVARLRWMWIDLDVGAVGHARPSAHRDRDSALRAVAELRARGIPLTALVDTGGGFHGWLRLREGAAIDHAEWLDLARRLAVFTGGDANVAHVEGVLRVAGTVNFKTRNARAVTLVAQADLDVDPDTLFALLPAVTPPVSAGIGLAPATKAARSTAISPAGCPTPVTWSDRPFDRANDVPVKDVMRALGHELHQHGRYTYAVCPRCRGTNVRKMVVGGNRNVACCFADCGRRVYTSVDLVVAALGCTPREAVRWLSKEFGFPGFAGDL